MLAEAGGFQVPTQCGLYGEARLKKKKTYRKPVCFIIRKGLGLDWREGGEDREGVGGGEP